MPVALEAAHPSESPCNLCPRMCGARRDEGERGACGTGAQMRIARAALHYWEEPPISGQSGSGTVFFSGCPLHCVYCQNAEIAAGSKGPSVGEDRLAEICLELEAKGALNVNFVTPTHHSLQIARAVAMARERGLSVPVVWNTSGYERVAVVDALKGIVDVYLADFKYADAALARRYSHAPDYPQVALLALRAMAQQVGSPAVNAEGALRKGVVVRHLLLPGALEQSKQALALLYAELGDSVAYSIMNQYTPVMSQAALARFPELAQPVPAREYEELLDFADDLGMQDYFWQDGPAAAESFIPSWNGEGVLRG